MFSVLNDVSPLLVIAGADKVTQFFRQLWKKWMFYHRWHLCHKVISKCTRTMENINSGYHTYWRSTRRKRWHL